MPGLGRSSGEGIGYPLQYSGLENSMDCIVRGVAKSRMDWATFTFIFMLTVGAAALINTHSSFLHMCVCVCYEWGYIFLQIDNNLYGTPLQYACLENPMDREAW